MSPAQPKIPEQLDRLIGLLLRAPATAAAARRFRMSKRVADQLVETLQSADVKTCSGRASERRGRGGILPSRSIRLQAVNDAVGAYALDAVADNAHAARLQACESGDQK